MGNSNLKHKQTHLKANLQMAMSRLTLMKNKKINQTFLTKDDIAVLLRDGKEEMAMIKVENLINNENFITAVEVVIMYCAQLIERVFQIDGNSQCPPDIRSAIETLVWASTKVDCKELAEVRSIMGAKFGVNFCKEAAENKEGMVNSIVRDKLVNVVPEEEAKVVKLQEIASEKRVDFVFKHQIRQEIQSANRPPLVENRFPRASVFPQADLQPENNYPANNEDSPVKCPPPNNASPPDNAPPGDSRLPSNALPPPPPSYKAPPPPSCRAPPANLPPPSEFTTPGSFPSPGNVTPSEPPHDRSPEKERGETDCGDSKGRGDYRFELPPSVPDTSSQTYDINSLEERFKRLK